MNDADIRAILPVRIIRGALLRPDGGAVGIVGGGAPAWDLRSSASRARIAAEYHRILLAQDAPVDIFSFDGAPNLAEEIADLSHRGSRAVQPTAARVLDDLAAYLEDHASALHSRERLTIWMVTVDEPSAGLAFTGFPMMDALFRREPAPRATIALTEAAERARRLADSLASLGGAPPPRLLEAEEIGRLLFRLLDPVRSARYPLAGALLERLRRVIATET